MATNLSPDQWNSLLRRAQNDLEQLSAPPQDPKIPDLDARAVAGSIDHTLLKLDATREQINQLCAEARKYAFKVRLYAARITSVQLEPPWEHLLSLFSSLILYLQCNSIGPWVWLAEGLPLPDPAGFLADTSRSQYA